jgi:STE24 endopeptidase
MVNAAVMGLIAPLRYVLITDAMLEQMSDEKIEAVYGHEIGHVKRQHILILLLFALTSGCLVTIFSLRAEPLSNEQYQIAAAIFGGVMLFKWGVLFGWISRKLERQADLFGVRTLALAGVPCDQVCALHPKPEQATDTSSRPERVEPNAETAPDNASDADPNPPTNSKPLSTEEIIPPDVPLCRTAAHVYGSTLFDVAMLNGIAPESRSWRHGSIAARARVVKDYAINHHALLEFEQIVRRIKWGVFAAAFLTSLWAVWELDVIPMGLNVARRVFSF